MARNTLSLLLLPLLFGVVCCRLISDSSDILSDGVSGQKSLIRLFGSEECENTYGFMPCTTSMLGNLFLILVYGYLMYLGATYLSSGSELLLEILGPGLIGGLFLPMLGALPDAMLIFVSGLSGSKETAQSQVSVGIGLLAGSTVMLLTIIWGSCVVVGKCDIKNSIAIDDKDTKGFSLSGSGVSTDLWTTYAAIMMAVSVIPFIIVQFPQLVHSKFGSHLAVFIALSVSVTFLVSYCLYQVFQPSIQRRRIAYSKHKHVISGILRHLKIHASGKLYENDGTLKEEVLRRLFDKMDENGDGHLSHAELRALIIGIQFEEINLDGEDAVAKVLKDFDTSKDDRIDFEEFVHGIGRWLAEARGSKPHSNEADHANYKYLDDFHEQTKREHYLLGNQHDDEESDDGVEKSKWTTINAVLLLLLGTIIAAAFADPLVDAVDNFSSATSIPSFFISFVALPLATNATEAVSAIIFATRKNQRSASLTFSELYGAVTMNNVLCLSVFLALVYVRGLTWDFSSEVLVILIVCIVMGIFGSVRTTFPLWTSLVAFMLYPFSLGLVYVLDYRFGWT